MHVTEAANEAKDNMKYLRSLEKFIKPLNNGTPQTLIDMMPNLLNRWDKSGATSMLHTVADEQESVALCLFTLVIVLETCCIDMFMYQAI